MEKIMISDNYKPVKLLGNGNSVNFSFDFPLISENFLQIFREKDGVQSLVGGGEYTVDFNDEGGVVTFNVAPEEGEIIAITRNIPLEQSTPYKTSSGFPADRIEGNFDTVVAIAQQMQEQIDRCVKVQVTDNQDPQELIDEVFDKLDLATVTGEAAIVAAKEAQDAAVDAKSSAETAENVAAGAVDNINAATEEAINEAKQFIDAEKQNALTQVGALVRSADSSAKSAEKYAQDAKSSAEKAKGATITYWDE